MTDAHLEEVGVENKQLGGVELPVTYTCLKFLENNPETVNTVELQFFYDLIYDKNEPEEDARGLMESRLVEKLAFQYGVSTGRSCNDPPIDQMWIVKASADPEDERNELFGDGSASCIQLVPDDTQKCTNFKGEMELGVVGDQDDFEEVIEYIRGTMNAGEVTEGTTSQVMFLATMIEDDVFGGKDRLPPAINAANEQQQQPPRKKETVTPEGIVFVLGLVAAFVALSFIVVRRLRVRRLRKAEDNADAVNHAESGDVELEQAGRQGLSYDDEGEPRIYGDSEMMYSCSQDPPSVYGDSEMVYNCEDLPEIADNFRKTFSFEMAPEMGDIQRNELLGVHGAAVVTGAGTNGGDAYASDSEVDSWAQTDASLGSIELRLEPITAEV